MIKVKKIYFIFIWMLLFFICFSSTVFAEQTGYSGVHVETKIVNGNSTTNNNADSRISVSEGNVITFEDEAGTHELTLTHDDSGKAFYILDGNTQNPIEDIIIKNQWGTTLANVSNKTLTYENGGYTIQLNRTVPTQDFERLELEFKTKNEDGTVITHSAPLSILEDEITVDNSQEYDYTMPESILGLMGKVAWNAITFDGEELYRTVSYVINLVLLPLGDGILSITSKSVGDVVTLDRLIFGKVEKVSINFWDKEINTDSVRAKMSGVMKYWYNAFYKIAIIVYMIVLVIVGILVMLDSTAEKKAKYKEILVSWVVGVAILTLFPYVMKYVVDINNAFVKLVYVWGYGDEDGSQAESRDLFSVDDNTLHKSYGTDEFVFLILGRENVAATTAGGENNYTIQMENITDIVMLTRLLADKLQQVFLTIIYLILLGETMVMLVMYYKRAFMVAFLITIFPLVAMTYVIDKLGDKKAQSFEIWLKEYVVNVIVQMFHAAVYVLVVGASITSYITSNGKNWLYVLLSVLFLFQGEKIFRNIFGIKSSANTIGDLATTGLATYGAVRSLGKFLGGKDDENASEEDKEEVSDIKDREEARKNIKKQDAPKLNEGDGDEEPPLGAYNGNDPSGVSNLGFDAGAALDKTVKSSLARRLKRGLPSRAVRHTAGMIGGVMGATREMAKGVKMDSKTSTLGSAMVGFEAGRSVGKWAATPITSAVNKVEQRAHGRDMERQIASGSLDHELGLDNPDLQQLPQDVDVGEVISKDGQTMQEVYRKALAEAAKVAASQGGTAGRARFLSYLEEHTTKK